MVTMKWKVYGRAGHTMGASYGESTLFKQWDGAIVAILNSDITGTNEYSIVIISADSEKACKECLQGQISDGYFENVRTGRKVSICRR